MANEFFLLHVFSTTQVGGNIEVRELMIVTIIQIYVLSLLYVEELEEKRWFSILT